MGEGSTVKIYMARLHRQSARTELEDAEEYMSAIQNTLIALAASGGEKLDGGDTPWYEHAARTVPELLEEYSQYYARAMACRVMLETPEDCVDDYDAPAEPEASEEPDEPINSEGWHQAEFDSYVHSTYGCVYKEDDLWACYQPFAKTSAHSARTLTEAMAWLRNRYRQGEN